MSLQFSNTTTKNGIIQRLERKCGFNDGEISGNPLRLAYFTGDVNEALNRALENIFSVGGTWQFDDINHSTNYPIITTDIVSGQRDYAFTEDGAGNLVLEISKVFIADENGLFREITPVDVPQGAPSNYWDGLNTTGQPNTYDKLGNGIFLDPIPNYDYTAGLKLYISREGSYFSTSDTTKKPGIAGLFHEYFVLRPAYNYCRDKDMKKADRLYADMMKMENDMRDFYKAREKDVQKKLIPKRNNAH